MKKLMRLLCVIVLLLGTLPFNVQAVEHQKGLDIVFVVDDSASMQDTDPNRLAGEAVRRFVDLLPAEGDKIGIVTYSYDPMARKELTMISGQGVKDEFKKFSLEGITQEGRNTDTGTGLLAGGELLDADKDAERQKAIVLITDGENDFRGRDRTEAESNAHLETFLKKGYPVYTIGVNPQTDSFKQYLTNIATVSNGKVWFPKTSEELNGIIKEVAGELGNVSLAKSDIVGVSPDKFTDIKQTIPKDVLEANLQIDHEEPITLELLNAKNEPVALNSKEVVVYSEERYTNVKLLSPMPGDWTLKIKSKTKNIQVKVDWIYSYDVELQLAVPETIKPGDKQTIALTLLNKGVAFTADQYEPLDVSLFVTDTKSNQTETYPMSLQGDQLVAEVPFEEGSYTIQAQVAGANLKKSSELVNRQVKANKTAKSSKAVNNKKEKEKSGFPLWLLILLGVLGLGLLAVILLKSKKPSSSYKLAGNLQVDLIEGDATIDTFVVLLGQFNKSSISLADAFMKVNKKLFLDGGVEKHIQLVAGSGHGIINFSTNKKSATVQIQGLLQNRLTQDDEATLTLDNSRKIKIRFK